MERVPEQHYNASGAAPAALCSAKEEQARRGQDALAYLESEGVPGGADDARPVKGEPWPEPESLGGKLPPVEKILPEMLPPAPRPFAEDIAARMQVSLDFPPWP